MLKDILKFLSFRFFMWLDRCNLHLLPKHYYTPIPDYHWLKTSRAQWSARNSLTGVHWDLDAQMSWLDNTCKEYLPEVSGLEMYNRLQKQSIGPGFGPIESQLLYCFIRKFHPKRVIEVGGGLSTASMLEAAAQNLREGKPGSQFTCIEPFPNASFSKLTNITHLQNICQSVPLSVFQELAAGDFLSIDSSHAVKTGSDVNRIYLEIIPNLPPNVFIHIHDIFLPYTYPRSILKKYFAWQETTLLLALLTHNPKLNILACLSGLHYDRTVELQELFTDYDPALNDEGLEVANSQNKHFPASIYLVTS